MWAPRWPTDDFVGTATRPLKTGRSITGSKGRPEFDVSILQHAARLRKNQGERLARAGFAWVVALVFLGITLAHGASRRAQQAFAAQAATALPHRFPGQAASDGEQSDNSKPQNVPSPSSPTAQGQDADSKSDSGPNEPPVGTTICAALAKTVDAKKAKAGDAVLAKATLAVLSHGKVLIANGAKITGHITRVRARSSDSRESEVGIVFDRVELKDGGEMRVALTLQAVGYGGLPLSTEEPATGDSSPYATLANPAGTQTRHSSVPRPQSTPLETPDIHRAAPSGSGTASPMSTPALDAGSKGVVGMPGLTLSQASEATQGSVVSSSNRNVKLESGSQLILRVIGKGRG